MAKNSSEIVSAKSKSILSYRFAHKATLRFVLHVIAGVAMLCLSANLEVPMQPVPFTLQILALAFIVATFSVGEATSAAASYVAIGAFGLPVFSGAMGGLSRLVGSTGGFILGFIAAAAVGSWLRTHLERTRMPWAAACLVSLVVSIMVVYVCGWAHLMVVSHLSPAAAFAAGVAPFIVLDFMKAGIATCLTAAGKLALKKDAD
jgi:biotin transport system substrate-specific component